MKKTWGYCYYCFINFEECNPDNSGPIQSGTDQHKSDVVVMKQTSMPYSVVDRVGVESMNIRTAANTTMTTTTTMLTTSTSRTGTVKSIRNTVTKRPVPNPIGTTNATSLITDSRLISSRGWDVANQSSRSSIRMNLSSDAIDRPVSYLLTESDYDSFINSTDLNTDKSKRTRTNFSVRQLEELETVFRVSHYPTLSVREDLAQRLALPESRIQVSKILWENKRINMRNRVLNPLSFIWIVEVFGLY